MGHRCGLTHSHNTAEQIIYSGSGSLFLRGRIVIGTSITVKAQSLIWAGPTGPLTSLILKSPDIWVSVSFFFFFFWSLWFGELLVCTEFEQSLQKHIQKLESLLKECLSKQMSSGILDENILLDQKEREENTRVLWLFW
jgi:hypothetical protein